MRVNALVAAALACAVAGAAWTDRSDPPAASTLASGDRYAQEQKLQGSGGRVPQCGGPRSAVRRGTHEARRGAFEKTGQSR